MYPNNRLINKLDNSLTPKNPKMPDFLCRFRVFSVEFDSWNAMETPMTTTMDYERPSMEMMRKTYCQWVDRPWIKEKMKVGDCYGYMAEFYEKFFDLNL